MTDVVRAATRPEVLARLRERWPNAVGYGKWTGARYQAERELTLREKRGELVPLWSLRREITRGVIRIPFVELKTPARIRRDRIERVLLSGACVLVAVGGFAWLVWESRYVVAAVGMAAAIGTLVRFASHWKRGCPGLHCASCRG